MNGTADRTPCSCPLAVAAPFLFGIPDACRLIVVAGRQDLRAIGRRTRSEPLRRGLPAKKSGAGRGIPDARRLVFGGGDDALLSGEKRRPAQAALMPAGIRSSRRFSFQSRARLVPLPALTIRRPSGENNGRGAPLRCARAAPANRRWRAPPQPAGPRSPWTAAMRPRCDSCGCALRLAGPIPAPRSDDQADAQRWQRRPRSAIALAFCQTTLLFSDAALGLGATALIFGPRILPAHPCQRRPEEKISAAVK